MKSHTTEGYTYRDGKLDEYVIRTEYEDGCVKETHREAFIDHLGQRAAGAVTSRYEYEAPTHR
jgi:hypothetical protein